MKLFDKSSVRRLKDLCSLAFFHDSAARDHGEWQDMKRVNHDVAFIVLLVGWTQ